MLNAFYKIYAGIIKDGLEQAIDGLLHNTQYGFRTQRGTTDALHCIHRVQEYAEQNQDNLLLALLDWEKAFDKIDHDEMWTALEEIGIPEIYITSIKALYKNPQFRVKEQGHESEWWKQETGIRQGCPYHHTYPS